MLFDVQPTIRLYDLWHVTEQLVHFRLAGKIDHHVCDEASDRANLIDRFTVASNDPRAFAVGIDERLKRRIGPGVASG
ncbi:hypothetical protein D9M72_635970 [compost metagenome]